MEQVYIANKVYFTVIVVHLYLIFWFATHFYV